MKVLIHIYNNIHQLVHQKCFEKLGCERVISSSKIEYVQKNIFAFRPDIFITHIHAGLSGTEANFELVRNLTQEVKNKIPSCCIVLTFHPDAIDNKKYCEANFHGYSYDLVSVDPLWYLLLDNKKVPINQKETFGVYSNIMDYARYLAS